LNLIVIEHAEFTVVNLIRTTWKSSLPIQLKIAIAERYASP
jgi:hypothetical protein